jgi:Protein of unknown function (DUF1552)
MMPLSRRKILAASAALPFLPKLTLADNGSFPQRLLLVLGPLNGLQPGWEPSGEGSTFTLSSRLAALEPFKKRLAIVNGLDGPVASFQDGHKQAMAGLWTGSKLNAQELPTSASLDQLLAPTVGRGTAFPTLNFGVMSDVGLQTVVSRMSFGAQGSPIPPENSPDRMYQRVFGQAGSAPGGSAASVLSAVKDNLKLVQNMVSKDDRYKIETHLSAVQSIEKRLDAQKTQTCSTPPPPAMIEGVNDNFPALYDLQTDILVAALACDRTRVATFQPSISISNLRFRWVPGISGDFHFGTMHGGTEAQRIALNEWFVGRFEMLLRKLDSVKEGDGTLLDHTTVVWSAEMAAGDHRNWPHPMIIAGGPQSKFRLGQHLKVDHQSHTRVLRAVASSLGAESLPRLGDYDLGQGPLPGLLA